ncbi:MAG: CBS domain-containing protein [Clostridia bacterium]|nr:CBS domain-containing protein [Clostridia bacterium]MBQ8522343.1 CBS domain-containing protein [Clostridia bacterium]
MKKISNANRFIAAYNAIDSSLRSIYNLKRSLNFSEVIRKTVLLNSVVRKYEDDLIDYGRLRNAIVHKGNSNFVIAEPHEDVVEKMEGIATLISTPPLAYDKISTHEVLCVNGEDILSTAIKLMARSGYSNLPVYTDNKLVGVLNGQRLMDIIGRHLVAGENIQKFIDRVTVGDIIEELANVQYYCLADEKITIEQVMNLFETNNKLLIVLITRAGTGDYPPLGIITKDDVIKMQKVLDVY